MHNDIKEVLFSEEQLKARISEIGAQITRDYAGKNLLMVSVLKGSVIVMADPGDRSSDADRFYVRFQLWKQHRNQGLR